MGDSLHEKRSSFSEGSASREVAKGVTDPASRSYRLGESSSVHSCTVAEHE